MSVSRPCFLVVDDHALFRTGLGLMLAQAWPDATVTQAASWGETLLALQRSTPDVILLDVHLPDGHGLSDLPALRAHAPNCPVLLMSAETDGALVDRARRAGAAGFVPKSASAVQVLASVRAALSHEMAFGTLPYALLHARAGDGSSAHEPHPLEDGWHVSDAASSLTGRQMDILRYLGRNTPNKAIARRMAMSENDVRAEVSWLTEWLGASSREQAYAEAVARGLLQP